MKINYYILSKKAQIGSTLTWFVAFLLIFFIMILFLSATIISAGRKKVTSGFDEVTFESYDGNLNSQKILFQALNSDINYSGSLIKLKEVLRGIDLYNLDSSKKNELSVKIKSKIDDLLKFYSVGSDKCYVFRALYGIDEEKILSNAKGSGGSSLSTFIEKNSLEVNSLPINQPVVSGYANKQTDKWLSKSSDLVLLRDTTVNVFGFDEKQNQIITIKFYVGNCL